MNREEALLMLGLEEFDVDLIEDAWEEKLFNEKQFFLSRVPIPKVFNSHLEKLNKLELAYTFLTQNTEIKHFKIPQLNINSNELDSILNAQTKLKIHVANAQSLAELKLAIKEIIKLEKAYCEWVVFNFQKDFLSTQNINIPLSQKPDIMDLKAAFAFYQKSGKEKMHLSEVQLIENELAKRKKWLAS